MVHGVAQGDLAKWLRVAASNSETGMSTAPIPARFVDFLVSLRCAEVGADGVVRITDKGRLALRMEEPTALHRMDDDEDDAQEEHADDQDQDGDDIDDVDAADGTLDSDSAGDSTPRQWPGA